MSRRFITVEFTRAELDVVRAAMIRAFGDQLDDLTDEQVSAMMTLDEALADDDGQAVSP